MVPLELLERVQFDEPKAAAARPARAGPGDLARRSRRLLITSPQSRRRRHDTPRIRSKYSAPERMAMASGSAGLVRDVDTLASIELLSPLPATKRLDIVPFVGIYLAVLTAVRAASFECTFAILRTDHFMPRPTFSHTNSQVALLDEYSTLCMWLLPAFGFVHLLVFLSAHWSNNVRAFLQFRRRSVRFLVPIRIHLCELYLNSDCSCLNIQ